MCQPRRLAPPTIPPLEPAKGHVHWDARLPRPPSAAPSAAAPAAAAPAEAAPAAHSEHHRAPAASPSAATPSAAAPPPAAPPVHSEHAAPAASPSPSPFEPAATAVHPTGGGEPSKATLIQFTAHAPLHAEGGELAGYGLYSYALLTSRGSRTNFFLAEILKHTPATKSTDSDKNEINLLEIPSIPADNDKCNPFADTPATGCSATVPSNAADAYDVAMAIKLLAHVCASAPSTLTDFCSHGFEGGGPYLLTYAKPVSKLTTIAPPMLLVDLTGKPESVFAEYLAAYEDQVKSADPTDGAKINTFRLSLLTWLSRAANAVGPIDEAAAGILNIVDKKPSQ